MAKGLRIDPSSAYDKDWLRKRGIDPVSLTKSSDMVTHRSKPEKVTEVNLEQSVVPKKKQKYGNKAFWENGVYWRSQWEYKCWVELRTYESAGFISNLETQVVYKFIYNEALLTKAVPDFKFSYKGVSIVADAKSPGVARQHKWKIQQNCMKAFYGIEILVLDNTRAKGTFFLLPFIEQHYEKLLRK